MKSGGKLKLNSITNSRRKRITVYVSCFVHDQLECLANAMGETKQGFVLRALLEGIQRYGPPLLGTDLLTPRLKSDPNTSDPDSH